MREITISGNDAGQRLNKFLMKYLNEAPSSFIYKMLRKKNITLNGAKAGGDELLCPGDSIKLFLADDTISKFQSSKAKAASDAGKNQGNIKLEVLYEDGDILAVFKPAGVLSQKAKNGDYSINEMIVDYLSREEGIVTSTFKPSVCNRLDRNTSGIILAGKSLKGSQQLSKQLKDRTADKYYFTIVHGSFNPRSQYTAYLKKDTGSNISEVIDEAAYERLTAQSSDLLNQYDKITMGCTLIEKNSMYSLIKIKLITGKSHQIRAHLNMLGHPIIGDNKYGDSKANRLFRDSYRLKHQLLHAGIVKLSDDIIIKADLPPQFKSICDGIGFDKDKIWQHGIQGD